MYISEKKDNTKDFDLVLSMFPLFFVKSVAGNTYIKTVIFTWCSQKRNKIPWSFFIIDIRLVSKEYKY